MIPILLTDFYKTEHYKQYPEGTTLIYSNMTARKSRLRGVDKVVVFGIQHFIKKYLIEEFTQNFFKKDWRDIEEEYKFAIPTGTDHIKELHSLGYLPIEIKALKEGAKCPVRVPFLTIKNTHPKFYWLTNYLETLMSCQLWQPITSATIASEYWKILSKYAKETTGSTDFVQWQAHDFSMRGMSSVESAILSGMGHLTSFTGTDTIPAIYALRDYYRAEGLIGASVPATEHSIMCMGGKEDEIGTFSRLLDIYPSGILSVVSDTWDLWKILTDYLPILKEKILSRDGKLVIRPDSGDPVDIICGTYWQENPNPKRITSIPSTKEQAKGVVELLWDVFRGTINEKGYKVLDSHIGAIYGDSITLERADEICKRLRDKGFASTNVVFGVGSYTYQMNTRDTFGLAIKATYGEVLCTEATQDPETWIEARELYKDPVTDDGTKKSAKGLICVREVLRPDGYGSLHHDTYELQDGCTWEQEREGTLIPVFRNGKLLKEYTLEQIRNIVKNSI